MKIMNSVTFSQIGIISIPQFLFKKYFKQNHGDMRHFSILHTHNLPGYNKSQLCRYFKNYIENLIIYC